MGKEHRKVPLDKLRWWKSIKKISTDRKVTLYQPNVKNDKASKVSVLK